MSTFDEILKKKLQSQVPVKGKENKMISTTEAMVNALMKKAMDGDIASISFIRNMTQTVDPEKERSDKEAHEVLVTLKTETLKEQLKAEKAYDGQDTEIGMLAEKAVFLIGIDALIARADFQPVTTDPRTGKQTISPLIQLRDSQRELFDKQFAKLRQEAINRILMRKQLKL